jgi:restriction endonuclease S subunit
MFVVDAWCKQHVKQGNFASVDMSGLYILPIPLPPLPEQQRIVSILDTFEASISNLEAQLEQRQKQYEYYRNQLLTFE